MITPSEIVQRIVGTYIEDDQTPKPPLLDWIQTECRHGCFKDAIEECVKKQVEPLRPDLVLVEKVEPEKITLRVPGKLVDHESPSAFPIDVVFELNPKTTGIRRV